MKENNRRIIYQYIYLTIALAYRETISYTVYSTFHCFAGINLNAKEREREMEKV